VAPVYYTLIARMRVTVTPTLLLDIRPIPGAPPTCSIWFHLGLLHIILDERLGIFEAYDDQLE